MGRYVQSLFRASALVAGMMAGAALAQAQQVGADIEAGKALVRQSCAQCHVVGPNEPNVTEGPELGPSFMSMKVIDKVALETRLHSKHPTMPQFPNIVKRVDEIAAYINTINK